MNQQLTHKPRHPLQELRRTLASRPRASRPWLHPVASLGGWQARDDAGRRHDVLFDPRDTTRDRSGLTLVEMLVSMAITLIMMAAVVTIFDLMGTSVNDSRATLEMSSRLRNARNRLQRDLASVTCPLLPWARPESGCGYFEYTEGPFNDLRRPRSILTRAPPWCRRTPPARTHHPMAWATTTIS